MQIHGSVQVSTWQYSHCNSNSWLGFPGIWGVMVAPSECPKSPAQHMPLQLPCCPWGVPGSSARVPSLGQPCSSGQGWTLLPLPRPCPSAGPMQGGAHWDKLKSAAFVGGHLSQPQISAGALKAIAVNGISS